MQHYLLYSILLWESNNLSGVTQKRMCSLLGLVPLKVSSTCQVQQKILIYICYGWICYEGHIINRYHTWKGSQKKASIPSESPLISPKGFPNTSNPNTSTYICFRNCKKKKSTVNNKMCACKLEVLGSECECKIAPDLFCVMLNHRPHQILPPVELVLHFKESKPRK